MRATCVAVGVAMSLLVGAGPADAGWSAPRTVAASSTGPTAVAVDARGDVALAWATRPPASAMRLYGTSVHVAVVLANGRAASRTVWSSATARTLRVAVALGHGEATLAWVADARGERLEGATVRAAYGPLLGRWKAARVMGHWTDFGPPANRYPRLAVSPAGEVLLVWDDNRPAIDAPVAAWRAPGHGFGRPASLLGSARVRLEVPHELGPIPVFDAAGNAYVWGSCDGIVVSAPAANHRFGRPVTVAAAPVLSFGLSVSAAGRGVAGWVHGVCTTDEAAGDTPGPVFASVLGGGRFGAALALSSAGTEAPVASTVTAPGGGGTVSWPQLVSEPGSGGIYSTSQLDHAVQIGPSGALGAATVLTGGLVPVAVDGAGDQVLAAPRRSDEDTVQGPLVEEKIPVGAAVLPAGGGPAQPAPSPNGLLATADPLGRAIALAWSPSPTGAGPTMDLSVWRP